MPDSTVSTPDRPALQHAAWRRWVAIAVCTLLVPIGCGTSGGQAPPSVPGLRTITILHTNDLHATLLAPADGNGGLAHLATAIRRERERATASVLVDAGDLVQGSPVSTLFEGVPMFELANAIGIEMAALGNHEFDYGWERIEDFRRTARFPLLAANVINDAGQPLTPPGYAEMEVGGVRLGIIGLLTARVESLLRPRHLGPWRAAPVVPVTRDLAATLAGRTDLLIAVGHLSDEEDRALLEGVPEVAVLVGGHNHAGLDTPLDVDGRLGVKVKSHGRELGRLDLTVDTNAGRVTEWRWQAIPVHTDRHPADPDVQALVDAWERRVRALVDVPIATARRTLSGDRLRRLLQNALAAETGADVAYLNPGGIRNHLPEGTVLKRHVWNVLPFDNEVVIATVRGANLPAVVRADARIDPARTYRFATIDFLAETSFARSGIAFEYTGRPMRDLAIDWIERRERLE